MHLIALFSFILVGTLVRAIPTGHDLSTRAPVIEETHDCSEHIEAFMQERRMKRSQSKRSFYWWMLNNTCVTSPQINTPDNWVAGAPITADISAGQSGIQLLMDVGVMDMSTCQPMTNALVEIWGANAMGQYSNTALRGGQPTNEVGIAEINTIFPGFTPGNAAHLGVRVIPNWSSSTSSVVPSSSAAYTGRLYFTDQWSVVMGGVLPYKNNPTPQTPNAQDPAWAKANSGGYYPIIDVNEIHDDWPEGVVGYITVGVNPKATTSQ